ncbi:type II toxin-antitoxin system VapC family toxin [Undibacterium sp. TC4M20W]|uniref:type II toxin-antitoxin system VapC family toxin n=1 Tax=Undibacterium sp. TC4M20W TaxID=3413052 RepID=UPI003BF36192
MRYMLDTNMASYIIKGNFPEVRQRLASLPMDSIVISVVTEAELRYGLARKGNPAALSNLVNEFLLRVEILAWDSSVAITYADLRASCTASGIVLGALDMMIAAHAIAVKARLVSHDKAFSLIPNNALGIEDWISQT